MKAVVIEAFGGVEELKFKDIDRPEIKADRLLVKLAATSVNPIDIKRRKGLFGGKLPMIVGGDVAGTVVAVGEETKGFEPGDRVMANGAKTYAEYVLVNPDRAVKLPANVDFETAAAVPLTGQTAYEAIVTRGQVQPGQRVLVHAGSGGVGSLAIQIAKKRGAWVAATASTRHQDRLMDLGADRAVDYTRESFEKVLEPVDLILDPVGGEIQDRSFAVLKEGGKLLSVAKEPEAEKFEGRQVQATFFSMKPTKEGITTLADWLEKGELRPVVSKTFPFSEAGVREAHELSETGHAGGKIILTFD